MPEASEPIPIVSAWYPWFVLARRHGVEWRTGMSRYMAMAAEGGADGWEPKFENAAEVAEVVTLAGRHGLFVRSFYANARLHDDTAEATVERLTDVARAAADAGVTHAVINAEPIRWGGPEDKTDAQLARQLDAFRRLADATLAVGVTTCYHAHDAEMRCAAREFHHMLVNTEPAVVKFCVDPQWVYRGSGDSNAAVLDVLRLYGRRVASVHLRQSVGGVWADSFGNGDIDYAAASKALCEAREGTSTTGDASDDTPPPPMIVLEQAIESSTPTPPDPVAAHRRSVEYVRRMMTTDA